MGRSLGILNLVQLPRLDALSAQSLGAAVISAARQYTDLPAPLQEAAGDVQTTLDVLNAVAVRRLPARVAADARRAKAADIAVDSAWSSVSGWLTAWSRMPGLPEADLAARLLGIIFPNGLKFTQIPYKLEWAESNTRLLLIDEAKLAGDFEQLGGAKLLARLRVLHIEYGEALGITDVLPDDAELTTIRAALDGFTEAIRTYVVRAASLMSPRDEKATAMAQALLAPIEQWETTGGKDGRGDVSAPAVDAAPVPAVAGEAPIAKGEPPA